MPWAGETIAPATPEISRVGSRKNWTTKNNTNHNGQAHAAPTNQVTAAVTAATNPNGAARNIAGILNENRNVLGMMPHPERLADALLGGTDGRPMFDGLAEALAPAA